MGVVLQILLWILKLLGILVLIVLGVLLLIFLVPIRYEIGGEADETKKIAKGRITWLLRLVHVRFGFDGAFSYAVNVCGIQILPGKPKSEKEAEASIEEVPIVVEPTEPELSETTVDPVDAVVQSTPVTMNDLEEAKIADHSTKKTANGKKTKNEKTAKEPISDKIKALWSKVQEIWAMVKDKGNQAAVKHVFREIGYLLKKILPRKLKAKGCVGFDDPCTTGQMTAVLAALLPYYKDAIQVEPDFEQKRLEGFVTLKGHIRLGIFVVVLVRLVLDKNIRSLIKKVLDMVKRNKGGIKNGRKQ